MLLLGAHLSVAGGVHRSVELARRLRCNCLQIFVKNQRQWHAPPLHPEHVRAWFDALENCRPSIEHIVAHSGYLINPASDSAAVRRKSVRALRDELRRCRQLQIDRLVLHPGSHRGQGMHTGIELVVAALEQVLTDDTGRTKILLETTCGAGHGIGSRLEEIAGIMSACKCSERVGCCLDTCHLFAAGYELSPRTRFKRLVREIDRLIGTDRVGCIHINDSAGALAGKLDRHQHIGRGEIGLEAFRYFLTEPKFAKVPKIIETPKGPAGKLDYDRRNLRTLRRLAANHP